MKSVLDLTEAAVARAQQMLDEATTSNAIGRTQHEGVMRELFEAAARDPLPFPTALLTGTACPPTVKLVTPEEGALVRFGHLLGLALRLEMASQFGSYNQRLDLFAHGGRSRPMADASTSLTVARGRRWDEELNTLTYGAGECTRHGNLSLAAALSLDSDFLRRQGIALDLSKVSLWLVQAESPRHRFLLLSHEESEPPLQVRETNERADADDSGQRLVEGTDTKMVMVDPWPQLPQGGFYSESSFRKPGNVVRRSLPHRFDASRAIDFAQPRRIRELVQEHLGWSLEEGVMSAHMAGRHIHSKFLDEQIKAQGVSHYAQLDGDASMQPKLLRKIEKVNARLDWALMKDHARTGHWQRHTDNTLTTLRNPNVLHVDERSGEPVDTGLPAELFEQQMSTYEALLQSGFPPGRLQRLNPFATRMKDVAAQVPFMRTLRAACHLSTDAAYLSRPQALAALRTTWRVLERWVGRMGTQLDAAAFSALCGRGRKDEIRDKLEQVCRVVDRLNDIVAGLDPHAEAAGTPRGTDIGALKTSVRKSPVRATLATLRATAGLPPTTFRPVPA